MYPDSHEQDRAAAVNMADFPADSRPDKPLAAEDGEISDPADQSNRSDIPSNKPRASKEEEASKLATLSDQASVMDGTDLLEAAGRLCITAARAVDSRPDKPSVEDGEISPAVSDQSNISETGAQSDESPYRPRTYRLQIRNPVMLQANGLCEADDRFTDLGLSRFFDRLFTTGIFQGSLSIHQVPQVIDTLCNTYGFSAPVGMKYIPTPDGPFATNSFARMIHRESHNGKLQYDICYPDSIAFQQKELCGWGDNTGACIGFFEPRDSDYFWTIVYLRNPVDHF